MHESEILADLLARIEAAEDDYDLRDPVVLVACGAAVEAGLDAGIGFDHDEPMWPVVYIELPTGQVSWHLPGHDRKWDGHDTVEKYRRCREYIRKTTE